MAPEYRDLCPYFGECGGCQSQDLPYVEQLARKEEQLCALFEPYWSDAIRITPSPVIWHYRNKVDPVFAPKFYPEPPPKGMVRETVLGFKKKGRWFWPLDIEECQIGPEGLPELLAAVRRWYREQGLPAFDSRTNEGFLHCLLVRDARRTGQRMVVLITGEGPLNTGPFVWAVQEAFRPDSIYRGIYRGMADVAAAEELELLFGEPAITERLEIPDGEMIRALEFRISPFSFFQTNPFATELLYGLLREWVRRTGSGTLYDLYGGAGGISLSCADLVRHVWSVECVASASEDGRHNARINGVGNVTFMTDNVKDFLRRRLEGEGLEPNSAVVVDPPRMGMHPRALERLVRLAPAQLMYVSCNPKILQREMPVLLERYRLRNLQAVDLFPHTKHVEVLAEWELR